MVFQLELSVWPGQSSWSILFQLFAGLGELRCTQQPIRVGRSQDWVPVGFFDADVYTQFSGFSCVGDFQWQGDIRVRSG